MFIGLLTSKVNASNNTKCVSLRNQKCMTQPTLISLHPIECSQAFHYYPFAVKLDGCVGSSNTLNDSSNKVRVPNETEDLNLSIFKMITGINESKTLTKHTSCKCKCKFDGRKLIQINGGITLNVNVSVENVMYVKKIFVWNPATCNCKNGKYLASIMNDSAITCDEAIDADADAEAKTNDESKLNKKETKTVPKNFNEKNMTFKTQNFYVLLAFLLITIALLIGVSIYCYLIKYQAKKNIYYHFNSQITN